MGDDARLEDYEPGETLRVEVRASYAFFERLCTDGYPADEYPAVDSLSEALRRAGEELPRHRTQDRQTVDISEASIEQLADALADRLADSPE